jgi:putative transposase
MASAVSLRGDYSATELRGLASATKNANQSRRLLSLAAVLDGMNRTEAARIGGMDRQTLRDWVHRFNDHGPEGLLDSWSKGPAPRLSAEQRAEIGQLVETGPGQGCARGRTLASDRSAARHRGALRDRLPRAHGRQAPQDAGLLAHQ